MTRGLTVFAFIALVDPHFVSAQHAQFDVASVKPQPFTGQGMVGITVHGDTLDAEHVSAFSLVEFAYNLRDVELSGGPAWVRSDILATSELYQVIGKAGDPSPPMADFRQMLATLLADRFHLQVHHVQKDLPVYNLVVNKGGPKLKEGPGDAKFDFVASAAGRLGVKIVATHMTMQELIDHQLAGYTDRKIFDKTGLTAPYDFTLVFSVENARPGLMAGQCRKALWELKQLCLPLAEKPHPPQFIADLTLCTTDEGGKKLASQAGYAVPPSFQSHRPLSATTDGPW